MVLFSLFLVLLGLPMILVIVAQKHKPKLKLPPGPKGLPFIGNLHLVYDTTPLHLPFYKLSQKYGPLMSLRFGSRRILVVSSAKMAEQVLKTHDLVFCSRPNFIGQQKLSYNGFDLAFAPYDSYWREIRKICVVHLFNSNRVQSFRPIREDEVSHMVKKITSLAGKPVNLSETMISLTSSIICRVAFGKRYEEDGDNKYHGLLADTQALFMRVFVSDYLPRFGFVDKLTGLIRLLDQTFHNCDAFYQQIIKEHLDPNRPKSDHEDILDVLLQLFKDRSFKVQLTVDHIKAVLMNVFVGGTDTSAATVVWAMVFLMKNPKAMKKAQDEVRNLIGKKGFVNEDEVQQLPYLKAVVKETMRLQPTTPLLIQRESREDCKLEEYDIKAKTILYVNVYAVGRDPQVWENPEEFYPERFIDSSIDLRGQHYELAPFGAGRRICPGMIMGLSTLELALANLLYKFNWEMPGGIPAQALDMDGRPGVAVHKKKDLFLVPSIYI